MEDDNWHYPDCSYPRLLQRILEYYPDIPGKYCHRRRDTDSKDEDHRNKAKASEAKPKAVRKNNDALIIEDWVSDSEEENMSQTKIEKKTTKPSFVKIDFVKAKQTNKTDRKTAKQSSLDARFKPSRDNENKVTKEPGKEGGDLSNKGDIVDKEKNDSVNNTNNINTASDGNNTNNVNTVSSTVNTAGIEVNVVSSNISIKLPNDPNMSELEDIVYSDDYEDVGAEADMNNLDTFLP
ncbi:hypothetical protein Tco_0978255, partial [Tanacetum coccineum]